MYRGEAGDGGGGGGRAEEREKVGRSSASWVKLLAFNFSEIQEVF